MFMIKSQWIAAIVVSLTTAAVSYAAPFYLYTTNFDSDVIGQLPAGWTVNSGSVNLANTSVQPQPGRVNVFKVGFTTESYQLRRDYTVHGLNTTGNTLAYEFDVNVDFINGNDSEGWGFYNTNNVTGMFAGAPRILRNGANWRIYNGYYTIAPTDAPYAPAAGGFNFDQWYRMRVEYTATSPSAGFVSYYLGTDYADLRAALGDDLFYTEFYSDGVAQTQNLQTFLLGSVTATGASMMIDNFVVVTPEPASLGAVSLLATAGLRRNRRRA
jgi:hypothetical protein